MIFRRSLPFLSLGVVWLIGPPGEAQEDFPESHGHFARVWDILDEDRDRHPIIVYLRDPHLLEDTFDDDDIVVTGPNGFSAAVVLDSVQPVATLGGDEVVGWQASYLLPMPETGWSSEMSGAYAVRIQEEQLVRSDGAFIEGAVVGGFEVVIGVEVEPPAPTVSLSRRAFPLYCDPDQAPESCHLEWLASVEGNAADGTYIREWNEPGLRSDPQRDPVTGTWFVELRAANIPDRDPGYPSWLPWLQVVDLGPPFGALRRTYRFRPEPGSSRFEVRYNGEVVARSTFTALDGPKLAFVESEPIRQAGTPSSIVTFKFYMPGGISIRTLGRDFDMEEVKPGRPVPQDPRFVAAREEANGWLAAEYEVFAPAGGWTFEDNGSYLLSLREDAVRSSSAVPFPAEKNIGFVSIEISDPSKPVDVDFRAESIARRGVVQVDVLVTYASDRGIDLSTIDRRDLRFTGFSGSNSRIARPISVEASADNRRVEVVYRIQGPTFGFQPGDPPVSVSLNSRQVKTLDGEANVGQLSLGEITVAIDPDEPGVFPSLSSRSIGSAGQRPFRFSVHYHSRAPINSDQLSEPHLMVAGVNTGVHGVLGDPVLWRSQIATLVEASVRNEGQLVVAAYELTPPAIGWSHLANGPLQVTYAGEVTNELGDPPFGIELLGEIQISIPKPEVEKVGLDLFREAGPVQDAGISMIAAMRLPLDGGIGTLVQWSEPVRRVGEDGKRYVVLDGTVSQSDILLDGVFPDFFDIWHRVTVPFLDVETEETYVLRLNGEEMFLKTASFSELVQEPLLPTETEFSSSKSEEGKRVVRATLHFDMDGIVVDDWGDVTVNGETLSADVRVSQAPDFQPENLKAKHAYVIPDLSSGRYQFVLKVNGAIVGETFFTSIPFTHTPYTSWLNSQITTLQNAGRRKEVTFLGDLDGDGVPDFEEWAFGSDALDGASRPVIEALRLETDDGSVAAAVRMRRPQAHLRSFYEVERSLNLRSWEVVPSAEYEVQSEHLGANREETFVLDGGLPSTDAYFRIRVNRR